MQLKEFDIVKNPQGREGVIVHIYPHTHCEVEYVNPSQVITEKLDDLTIVEPFKKN